MQYYRKIKKTSILGNDIEFSCKPGVLISSEIINGGMENEERMYRLKGKIRKNKPTVVATMKVSAAANKRFQKAPGLIKNLKNRRNSSKNSLKVKLKSTVKDADKNIISYLYDIIYTAKQKESRSSSLKYNLSTSVNDIVTRVFGINKLDCGKETIVDGGETRRIKIIGDKGATFKLSIVSLEEQAGAGFDGHFIETNVLNGGNATLSNHMGTIDIIDAKLDNEGRYVLAHKFPANSTGVKNRYSVNILPTIVKSGFTNLYNNGFYEKNRPGWDGWYSKIITQPLNPIITLRAVFIDNLASGKTTSINGVVTSGGANYDKEYEGMYDMTVKEIGSKGFATSAGNGGGKFLHDFEITYRCITNAGTIGITKANGPSITDWHNTGDGYDSTLLYGNNLNINTSSAPVLSTTSTSNDTCTFKVRVKVNKWGTENLILKLDINNIITIS